MYNDEKNLYHYTYRRDGSETPEQAPVVETAYREAETSAPKRSRSGRAGA